MRRWTELVVRIADLAEAEGRTLREAVREEARHAKAYVRRLGVGASVLVAGTLFILAGAGLVLAGLFLWLDTVVGTAAAAALSGFAAVVAGSVLIWTFRKAVT